RGNTMSDAEIRMIRTAAEEQLRGIALRAVETEKRQSARLARFLHDEVAQVLSGAGLQLDILRMDLESKAPEIAPRTAEIQDLLETVVRRIRDVSYELHPEIVERAGLQPALDMIAGRAREKFNGTLRLRYDSSLRIPVAIAVAMHRIADEAVQNAIRHSRCTKIEIIVKPSRGGPSMEITDDGDGFDYLSLQRSPCGLGLLVMDHYASSAGLTLTILSMQGESKGTTVRVKPTGAASTGK
ncbi:MAG: ATP-binding protein, partial [Bryobacteraceae bacterium]